MATDKPRVYLAGAIQHSRSRGKGWRQLLKSMSDDFEWVDPIDKYDSTNEAAEWEDERVVAEDKEMIDNCDAVLLHYEKVPSWGTPREQEYATANDIPVFVQTTADDPSPWLTVDAECVVPSFADALWHMGTHFGLDAVDGGPP
jgi:nucleoside 2-deoxyribosyltransferase